MAKLLKLRIKYLEERVNDLGSELKEYENFLAYILHKKKRLKLDPKVKEWSFRKLSSIRINQVADEMKIKLDEELFGDD